MYDINKIMNLLPHRYPFLLIDRIVEAEPQKRIVAIKNVSINEPFFQGHFPGHPIMPGVLLLEAMAQAGGVLNMLSEAEPEKKVTYFATIDNAKFRKPVMPGDQVRFEIDATRVRGAMKSFKAVAKVDGAVVAEAEMMAMIVDKDPKPKQA